MKSNYKRQMRNAIRKSIRLVGCLPIAKAYNTSYLKLKEIEKKYKD